MKFVISQSLNCGVIIPDGQSLDIDNFTFLPDSNTNPTAKKIMVTVEADTKEEAVPMAQKQFNEFLAKLTLIDNSKYILEGQMSVLDLNTKVTTNTMTVSAGGFIVKNGNEIKNFYESKIAGKKPRKKPLGLYRDAILSDQSFERYRNFYRVLECYFGDTISITTWIKAKEPRVTMKKK
ncbi:MAG: hypothetical protein WC686_02990 [Candidatus Shapirobacteria bacterium]|jgi:hypothetical protein